MDDLSNNEAKTLCRMKKYCRDKGVYPIPGDHEISLYSDEGEEFIFTIRSRCRDLSKSTFQTRLKRTQTILVRLDIKGKRHKNPGEHVFLSGTHIHIFKEGFGDRIAYSVPSEHFSDISDIFKTLSEFMTYCNVVQAPAIQARLDSYAEI